MYQKGLDYCVNLLNEGKWVHVFPEGKSRGFWSEGCDYSSVFFFLCIGKINMTLGQMRLKWGEFLYSVILEYILGGEGRGEVGGGGGVRLEGGRVGDWEKRGGLSAKQTVI